MGMIAAIREILREAGEPLTSTEIRDRIQQGYPELYGTRVHEIHYPSIDGWCARANSNDCQAG